jgi:hypothetical protein
MFTDRRRSYSLSKDQPILQQARRRRSHLSRVNRPESEFWKSFNLEKFARDWGRQLAVAKARG